ncbi:tRNA uridine-5-carboxymethylaminomethyl(34) synthesis GTPase MnmE [Campylobacter ureolyticus]|jgi:tRNA modification GTPase trmE|uniref:tRNA modification GTPase MnmE n=1 Tax=Campylobacter ureolyticus TaxID=827 RepID=A0A9Q4KK42_9BACT|nr:tRNA uridine-5-carboxymethylaminomethyl(34) synthesis GTPase MnmE [Campylobacter ureolyticus]MCZ6116770.1 tRNA uridine-5-carboxymethylaminomethyl(34) synthesis GTPase MnmE [Campylobacter ureolyticus]MCZ6158915.1 tRNA uridine-5-carboxymethylaminomethyl(34) synthesis GTPase MnmE [Campylobacter ureolyticus]MCZ6163006.1 tRNA uridine-5-carboxymethylaminomethyl(34) synthesis GTPase MnmE [Campylobacter ureolyticus]MCZ6164501.1 tRNA uridine-5-carboxymethylaminomethyl(34) synthesis GTPase MnmE [Campy
MNDTIVAISTANGVGAVSIIRVSGKEALDISLKLLKTNKLTPRYATLLKIYSLDNELIDRGIIIYFKSPKSFTGEDIVEFQTHGGFLISNLIIDELLKAGARLAKPGEFSKRAFLNDKMDLAKASSIQSLITARSKDALKILTYQMQGSLSEFVESLRGELVKTLAYTEVCIDYAEEDLPTDILEKINTLLGKNYKKLDEIVTISKQRKGLIEGFKIAIIGKPNVGKSSLLNALLSYDRAIISNEAGTTRDSIEESLMLGSHLVRIIDTAGIREGVSSIEKIGIKTAIKKANEADIVLAVFDSSAKFDEEDKVILEICMGLEKNDKKIFYILNKSDLIQKFDKKLNKPLQISAKEGIGLVTDELKNYLDTKNYDGIMLTATYQINAVNSAKEAILRAKNLLNENELELFAYEINSAISEISSITRPFERTEILDEMFSSFCLGK